MSRSFAHSFELCSRYPAFARVFWADLAAQMGHNMLVVALPTLILEITHDVTLTGLAFSGEILAYGLLSPWAGWVADRCEQKRLMMGANLARFLLLLALLTSLSGSSPLWLCLTLSMALGATAAFFSPARAAFLRRLLSGDELLEAVALEGTCGFLVRLVAPALMGIILVVSDARVGIAVDAATYLVSLALLAPAWVSGPFEPAVSSRSEGSWRGGWQVLLGSADLRGLLLVDLGLSFLGMASWSTAVAYLEQVLHVRAANNGWLQAAMGLTGALGSRGVVRFRDTPRLRWALLGLITLSYLGMGASRNLPALVCCWMLRGLGIGAFMVLMSQQIARQVPSTHMGRVQAAWEQSVLLACLAGSLMTPWLLREVGALASFRLYGWAFLTGYLVALVRALRAWRCANGALPSAR